MDSNHFILGVFNNPDVGSLLHRPAVLVLDSSTTVLPSGSSVSADSTILSLHDRVLFTNLSDANKNNRIYRVARQRDALVYYFEYVDDGSSPDGKSNANDAVYVKGGTKSGTMWIFDGATWRKADLDASASSTAAGKLSTDGSNSPTADISWASHKITNLSDGSGPSDAATKGQLDTDVGAVQSSLNSHLTDYSNPHQTTADQVQALALDGSNDMHGSILFDNDLSYSIGGLVGTRPNVLNTLNVNVGTGIGETGHLRIGDSSLNSQVNATGDTMTWVVNGRNTLDFRADGNINIYTDASISTSPKLNFMQDGQFILGGYPDPTVSPHRRPGYMAAKYALGIGTGTGETGCLVLGDNTLGNQIYGYPDGSLTIFTHTRRTLTIAATGSIFLHTDSPGGSPAINFYDGLCSIGASSTTSRPSNVWVKTEVGIGRDGNGTLSLGSSNCTVTSSSAKLVLTPGSGGTVVVSGQLGTSQSASASGPVGSVVKKLQVFDQNGSSLGYIAIYNSIT